MSLCEICGQAEGTRWLQGYNGMAGSIWACNKKAHDLTANQRRKAKDEFVGIKRQAMLIKLQNPMADIVEPKFSQLVKAVFKDIKFALTRQEQKDAESKAE